LSKETIELAKNYDPRKSIFPAVAQRKWDGVPARFIRAGADRVVAFTRQGERIDSVDHLIEIAGHAIPTAGGCIIGELVVPGMAFKDTSGIVRRGTKDERIICKVFDGDIQNQPKRSYAVRLSDVAVALPTSSYSMHVTPGKYVHSVEDIERYFELLKSDGEDIEGVMFHDPNKPFQPGKRCWGMGRWKPQPVATLEVVGFEEAHSEAGRPLGMVGRVNVRLRRKGRPEATVGVGPGKMDHEERKHLWKEYGNNNCFTKPMFADIKYMPDPTYEALRQPTFQCWRPDKTEGDILD
jgi:ATP-dependent DNA ligase